MLNIIPKPTPPSFVFGYWRPWNEDSNIIESYLNYSKDKSLANYSASIVGTFINQASKEQVKAIGELGKKIGMGMNALSNQMESMNAELVFMNRNIDIQVEQNKMTNLLLQNIAELLRVPDSEKERQHCIELGLKFFVNAQKDEDLFDDALDELKKAEELMRQDYFVLHRIGLLYLYSEKHINPKIALDYFTRAAKYAVVESDVKAARLANVLAKYGNRESSENLSDALAIQSLAADSYEKAAFSAYVLGEFELAVTMQTKALKYNSSVENRFLSAKYQARTKQIELCIQNLELAIDKKPWMVLAVFKDLDLINEPEVLKLIEEKNNTVDKKIQKSIDEWGKIQSDSSKKIITQLVDLLKATYNVKVDKIETLKKIKLKTDNELKTLQNDVQNLKEKLKGLISISKDEINKLIKELDDSLSENLEVIRKTYLKINDTFVFEQGRFGFKFAGGIVFYIDKSGNHGLVAAEIDQGKAIWGGKADLNSSFILKPNNIESGDGIENILKRMQNINVLLQISQLNRERELQTKVSIGAGENNTKLIVEEASWCYEKGWFSKNRKPFSTAARICAELSLNGFNDWFLPSAKELNLMYTNLHNKQLGSFKKGCYWSSSETGKIKASCKNFGSGKEDENYKDSVLYVRAIRAF